MNKRTQEAIELIQSNECIFALLMKIYENGSVKVVATSWDRYSSVKKLVNVVMEKGWTIRAYVLSEVRVS